MADRVKNKFSIGTLVAYDWKKVSGAIEKVGVVTNVKESKLNGWTYIVTWTNGLIGVYPERALKPARVEE